MNAVPFTTSPFTGEDWSQFETFAQKHFGFCHLRSKEFNEHWFGPELYSKWNVRQVTDAQGTLSGLMMLIVMNAKFGDTVVPFAWISNSAVVREAQDRGIGAQLYFWVYKSYPLVGALSGNKNSNPINSHMALDIPGTQIDRYLFLFNERCAKLCEPHQQKQIEVQALDFLVPSAERAEAKKLSFSHSKEIPDDFEAFWAEAREQFFLCTERTRKYLEWRFLKAPWVSYELVQIRDAGKLVAFAALRFQTVPNGEVCRVVDFVALPEHATGAWIKLLGFVKERGCLFLDFFMIGNAYRSVLQGAGLKRVDEQNGLDAVPHLLSPVEHRKWSNTFNIGGALAKKDERWRAGDKIYFTKSDSDRDWPTQFDVEGHFKSV